MPGGIGYWEGRQRNLEKDPDLVNANRRRKAVLKYWMMSFNVINLAMVWVIPAGRLHKVLFGVTAFFFISIFGLLAWARQQDGFRSQSDPDPYAPSTLFR
jgi:hypothetical protein